MAERIQASGGVAKPFVADVCDVSAVRSLVKAVMTEFGRIDILVNSARVFYQAPIGETSESDYDRCCRADHD